MHNIRCGVASLGAEPLEAVPATADRFPPFPLPSLLLPGAVQGATSLRKGEPSSFIVAPPRAGGRPTSHPRLRCGA